MRWSLGILCLLLVASGCKNGSVPKADPPTGSDPALASHMTEHFLHIVRVRDAVSTGNYEATRKPARWLAEKGASSSVPVEWAPMVADLRTSSAALDRAEDLSAVAAALGPVVQSCGDCHEQLAVTIEPPANVKKAAPVGDTFEERMARHAWALDQMWFGLVAPAPDAWMLGANAVAADTLHPPKGPAMPDDAAELEAIADSLKELAVVAQTAKNGKARANVYSDMLLKCVACHDHARPR